MRTIVSWQTHVVESARNRRQRTPPHTVMHQHEWNGGCRWAQLARSSSDYDIKGVAISGPPHPTLHHSRLFHARDVHCTPKRTSKQRPVVSRTPPTSFHASRANAARRTLRFRAIRAFFALGHYRHAKRCLAWSYKVSGLLSKCRVHWQSCRPCPREELDLASSGQGIIRRRVNRPYQHPLCYPQLEGLAAQPKAWARRPCPQRRPPGPAPRAAPPVRARPPLASAWASV